MKPFFKKICLILILAFTTFFSSCEKDLYEEAIIRSDKGLKIRKISLNEVSRSDNPELYRSIDQLKVKQEKIHARLVYDSINNFYYDDENGKVIEDELGVKSYTFPVYRENSDGKIENVLFSRNQNGEFETFLVKYDFTDEQLKLLSQYEISQQTAVYTNISANKTIELCIEFWEWISYPINQGELTGNFGYTGEWILKKKICEDYNEYLDPGLGNTTGVEPISPGTGGGGAIGNSYTTPVPLVITHEEALRRKFFVEQILTPNQETYFNSLSLDIKNAIFQFLADNSDDLDAYNQEAIDFAKDLINFSIENQSEYDNENIISETIKVAIYAKNNNYENQPLNSSFYNAVDSYSSVNFIDPIQALNFARMFVAHCAVIKKENPTWSYWGVFKKAWSDTTHLVADIGGLVPVIGEFADLANGTLYAIEGDGANAALSYASAIPIGGWFAAGIKFAKRADGLKFVVVGTNNLISFGTANSKKFRAACGIAVGDGTKQAHHLIPRGSNIPNHPIVQKAAQATTSQGFHIDSALNGIAVATWRNQPNHNIYNNRVIERLNAIPSNLTPNQTFIEVQNLLSEIRTIVVNNPNVHLNDLIF